MTEEHLALLKQQLAATFVPQLPPLLDLTKPADHQLAKNISRSLSAFALQKLLKLDVVTAANAVTDDFEDNGIDAVHYHQASKKVFLVQSKLKATEPFGQDEAQAFSVGIRDLSNQRYDRFNKNIQDRQTELELALDEATEIVLVIAHTSEAVSEHAKTFLNNFLTDNDKPDERLQADWIDFGPADILTELLAEHAVAAVDDELILFGEKKVEDPRVTYYGQVSVAALASLYGTYGNRLLEKNIRYFLGINSSAVNRAINTTLDTRPNDFFYLSNGVTAIASTIEPKGVKDGGRKFEVKGLSVINGAQTVASCHHFVTANAGKDISAARVMLTLIKVDNGDPFSGEVTRARNHQNPVSLAHFAALDNMQERLRRELAFQNVAYRYRPEARDTTPGLDVMSIDEAAVALALFHPDPNLPISLKREPSRFLDSKSPEYAKIFGNDLTGQRLANAVRFYRRASAIIAASERAAAGSEKLIYRHGRYVIMWLTFRANAAWLDRMDVIPATDVGAHLSAPLDAWREKVRAEVVPELARMFKGPLAFFRTLTNARPFLLRLRDAGI